MLLSSIGRRSLRGRRAAAPAIGLVACVAVLLSPTRAPAAGYVNPFAADTISVGRTDMGVDICLAPGEPIRAVGDGVVAGTMRNWYAGQPYLWYELTSGPDTGRYVYVAEQIDHLAPVGRTVHAGDVIARYAARGSCLETGWSEADGATVAQSSAAGYSEGEVTAAGISFARLLLSLGVLGSFQLTAPVRPATATHPAAAPVVRTSTRRAVHRTSSAPRPPVIRRPSVPSRRRPPATIDRRTRPRAPIPSAPATIPAPRPAAPAPAPAPAPGSAQSPWWDMAGDPFPSARG